ncbi:polysaccharide deacetylase family protein [Salinimicrobium sp. WS361]|uniref:polysaccharide deacetylase family protein n=1 Tax=Salinimicrobium sp. WS361 TaxID=3425123 RepID=UPI003D6F307A
MAGSNKLRVLAYHSIQDSVQFEQQMLMLKSLYTILDVHTLRDSISLGALPKNPILITFDDGDSSLYHKAFPILKKLGIPATIFVITGLINSQRPFWWDEIEYYLGKEAGNKKVWEVKSWPNIERESFLKKLRNTSIKSPLKYKQLTSAQLKEMQDAGIIIANHSHTHPMFDQCTQEELVKELTLSTNKLKFFGFTPNIFAYPNGNFSARDEIILKNHGINQAFLFDHRINKNIEKSLRISRLIVNDTTPIWKFKLILSGWHTRILPLTRLAAKLTGRFKK